MKKIQNKKLEFVLALFVEFIEFSIIVAIGHGILNVGYNEIAINLLTFFITRLSINKLGFVNGHYKINSYFDIGWRRCFGWTSLLCFSFFLTSYLSFVSGILFTVFSSILISNIVDIEELTMGKRKKDSEYQQIYAWIRLNRNDTRLIAFEENLKRENLLYVIYMNMFINGLSPMKMADKLYFKSDISVYPYVNRIIGRLSDSIFEVQEICEMNQNNMMID